MLGSILIFLYIFHPPTFDWNLLLQENVLNHSCNSKFQLNVYEKRDLQGCITPDCPNINFGYRLYLGSIYPKYQDEKLITL